MLPSRSPQQSLSQLLLLLLLVHSAASWNVLQNTDFPGNCHVNPDGPGASVEDCADQCAARSDCVAVSWNGPQSKYHDGNCNFKCTTLGQHADEGEQVRSSVDY